MRGEVEAPPPPEMVSTRERKVIDRLQCAKPRIEFVLDKPTLIDLEALWGDKAEAKAP